MRELPIPPGMSKLEYLLVALGVAFAVGTMMLVFSPPTSMTSETIERINRTNATKP